MLMMWRCERLAPHRPGVFLLLPLFFFFLLLLLLPGLAVVFGRR